MNALEFLRTLDSIGFHAVHFLLSILWQSSIIFIAVFVLSRILRRQRASVRHVLWVSVILAVPLMPVLTWVVTSIGTPQAPIPIIPSYSPPETGVISQVQKQLTREESSTLEKEDAVPITTIIPDEFQDKTPVLMSPEKTDEKANVFSPASNPWAFALTVYIIGAAFFIFIVLSGRLRIHRWLKDSTVVTDNHIMEIFRSAGEKLGLARDFVIAESDAIEAPITIGTFHPVILLPLEFSTHFTASDMHTVALHELAHVRRYDALTLTLVSIIRAVFFFHPFVWIASRRVSFLAENACDVAVIEATGEPLRYAKLLTNIAEKLPKLSLQTELAVGIIFSKSAFLRRVEAILSQRRDQIRRLSRIALAGTVTAVILSLVVALALPLGNIRESGDMIKISGMVTYRGEPVAGAIIYFNDQEMSVVEKVGKTDKTGSYTFEIEPSRLSGSERLRPAVIAYSPEHSMGWQQIFFTSAFGNVDIILNDPLSIEGIVTDTSGNPVKGAVVVPKKLWYNPFSVQNLISFDENSIDPLVSRTDKKGHFILDNLPPECGGFITIQKKGYAIEVISNIRNSLGDKVTITLKPESRIEGRVTYRNSGAPAKNVKVMFRISFRPAFTPPLIIEDTTDKNGFYSLTNLPEGHINIYVMSSEEDKGIVAIKKNIPLKSGEILTGVDFSLGQGGIITGRVIDEDTGEPIKNHRVGYYIYERFINTTDPALCYTTTDETGTFRLRSFPGKAYIVTNAPDGYVHEDSIKREVEVVEGESVTVDAILFKKSTLLQGIVQTNDGKPVSEAKIIITYERPGPIGTTRVNMLSDKDGIFNLRGFKNGEQLILRAIHPALKVRGINDTKFTLDADANIICEPFETTSITGRVIDFKGNPISSANITLLPQTLYNMGFVGVYAAWTLTDQNGVYTTDGLIIGDSYYIRARKKGYATPIFVKVEDYFTALKNMPPHKDLILPKTDRILEGTVTDSEGNPVFGASVDEVSDSMSGFPMTNTDAEGNYLLEDLAEVVIRTISISHRDYGSYRFYDIPTNETHNFTLIKPLGSFTGKIVDSEKKPVEGAQIYIESNLENISGFRVHESGFEFKTAITDKQGKFQFEHVINETIKIRVWKNELGRKIFENINTINGEVTLVFDKPDEVQQSTFEFNKRGVVLLEGKKAPELKVDRWINKDPGTIAGYKGKVVIMDFNKIHVMGAAGALRRLKAYSQEFSSDDAVFIGILEHNTDIGELQRFIDKMGVTCSIAVDTKSPDTDSGGITFDTYGISNSYQTVIIDREGNVHLDILEFELEVKIREYIKDGKG